MTKLEITERLVKWGVALWMVYKGLKFAFVNVVKLYKKSADILYLLESIKSNQDYDKLERRAIMNKISLGYFTTDLEGKSIEIGDVVCKVFGYSEAELLEFGWSSFVHPDDQKRVMESIIEDLKYERNGDLEYRIITATKEVKKVHVKAERADNKYFCTLEVIK